LTTRSSNASRHKSSGPKSTRPAFVARNQLSIGRPDAPLPGRSIRDALIRPRTTDSLMRRDDARPGEAGRASQRNRRRTAEGHAPPPGERSPSPTGVSAQERARTSSAPRCSTVSTPTFMALSSLDSAPADAATPERDLCGNRVWTLRAGREVIRRGRAERAYVDPT
jgi:hypothetical protein